MTDYHERPASRRRMRENGWKSKDIKLTFEEFEARVIAQEGRCAICGKQQYHELVVDHDHTTGAIRGLLCHRCNRMLGQAGDNTRLLRAAIAYLASSSLNPRYAI